MKTTKRSRGAVSSLAAGILLLSGASLAWAAQGDGPGGNPDPCVGNAYRDICDTFDLSP